MWESAVLTNAGRDLLAQWAAGGELTIDKAACGQGTVNEAYLMGQTQLVAQKKQLSIVRKANVAQGVQLQLQCTNGDVSTAFTINQIGVWAHLDDGASVMIAIYQDSTGVLVPSAAEMADYVFTFYATLQMSNTGELTVTIDSSALVSMETFSGLEGEVDDILDGTTTVPKATHAASADSATNATTATNANHATTADSATNATNATNADHATSADSATNATNATSAQKATADASGNTITSFYAHNFTFTVNNSTFVLTAKLISASGETLATQTVDLPLESVVVGGEYDDATKEVVLTLQSGSEVRFSVADLVDGLASQTALNEEISARQQADTALGARIDDIINGITPVANATNATNAQKATADAAGNTISTTYATKTENAAKLNKPTIEQYNIAASAWTSLSNADPFTVQATVTATTTIGGDAIIELYNDQPVAFATYAFSIASVSGQTITFYALEAPTAQVTLSVGITN